MQTTRAQIARPLTSIREWAARNVNIRPASIKSVVGLERLSAAGLDE